MNKSNRKLRQGKRWLLNRKELIQTIGAIFSVIATLVALILSFISYSESQILKKENSIRDSITENRSRTQFQIRNDYDSIQNGLLKKYGDNADSILGQLKIQSKITKAQYEAQIIINSPLLSFSNSLGHDANMYDSFSWKGIQKWRLPTFQFTLKNFGLMPTNKIKIKALCFYPESKIRYEFPTYNFSLPFNPKEEKPITFYPPVPIIDKDYFFMKVIITWENQNLPTYQENIFFYQCLFKDNKYIIMAATDTTIDLLNLFQERSVKLEPDDFIKLKRFDIYNK